MIGFDKNKQLSSINFTALYGSRPNMPSYRQAERNYQKLVRYFSEKAGQKGKKVIYYKKGPSLHEGYEWACNNAVLKVDFQSYNHQKGRTGSLGITLERKP